MRIARRTWPWCAAVLVLAGCGDRALDPQRNSSDARGIVVSEAVSAPVGRPVTWVSLPPGAAPEAVRATITTSRAGSQVTTAMVEGGFDPVAVAAEPGDTVAVIFSGAAGLAAGTASIVVPLLKPPVIVRTEPPKRKRDVPLNQRMRVIFSEPMDPRSVTGTTVRLLRGGVPVAGSVTLSAEGWLAEFVPDQPLSGQTDYVLQVSTGATDLAGDPLAEAIEVEFRTESVGVAVAPDTATLMPGARLALQALVTDSAGNAVQREVSWRSSDTAVAVVDGTGLVTAMRGGEATVTAAVGSASATARIRVAPGSWVALGADWEHTCAVADDGRTYCWGYDAFSYLGPQGNAVCGMVTGSAGFRDSSCLTVPSPVPGAPVFTSLAGGAWFNCGLAGDGSAYCWGAEWAAPHTGGFLFDYVNLRPVAGGHTFVELTAGTQHACGITAGGQAYCWGENGFGQLGDGSTTSHAIPVPVAGGITFASISAGRLHTCGVALDGSAWCWGSNAYGQLGTGRIGGADSVPVLVTGGLRFTSISAGTDHTCAFDIVGTAFCWGSNSSGQLGTGSSGPQEWSAVPVRVQTTLLFSTLQAGAAFTCGLTLLDGAAYCWGYQTGRDPAHSTVDSPTPTGVVAVWGVRFKVLDAGQSHTCGITSSGQLLCWGGDNAAQIRPFMRP